MLQLAISFPSSSVVSRAFSALCVHLKFRHHPHPLGYLCAKFRFFCSLHCWASPWRKIAYSLNHSITRSPSLFDAPGIKAFVSEQTSKHVTWRYDWSVPRAGMCQSYLVRFYCRYKFEINLILNKTPYKTPMDKTMQTQTISRFRLHYCVSGVGTAMT